MVGIYGVRMDAEEKRAGLMHGERYAYFHIFDFFIFSSVLSWKHAHYGIDTDNFIESWHSNLKKNYIGRGRKQRLDHIIHILTQCVEPDYLRVHIRGGLGFKARKAEIDAKKAAYSLPFDEAAEYVIEVDGSQVHSIFLYFLVPCYFLISIAASSGLLYSQ